MDLTVQILLAFFLDLLIGDPSRYPHPVRIIGFFAKNLERFTRRYFSNPILAGGITASIVVIGAFVSGWTLLWALRQIHPLAEAASSVFLIYTCLSIRSLYDESRPVLNALKQNQEEQARKYLSRIVGRDTENLNQKEIVRATVETIAESTIDGIIAPLFYAFIGGAPLALAYKATNTLDSMFGYKNNTYKWFGMIPARLDDAANWVPARLGGALMALAAAIIGFDGKRSWTTVQRDGAKHLSPNAGIPEAAMAGALGVQLGGSSYYEGHRVDKPYIGSTEKEIAMTDISQSHKIMFASSVLALVALMIFRKLLESNLT